VTGVSLLRALRCRKQITLTETARYRVNFEVSNLKPFPYLAFPHFKTQRTPSEIPSFDGELMASLNHTVRKPAAVRRKA
jgi:hypothetical protein